MELTFEEQFDTLSLWNGKTGRWKNSYIWGNESVINEELQYYLQADKGEPSPFIIKDGKLAIQARPTPESLRKRIPENRPYVSGLLTTEKSFSQRYGRFEIRARFPAGQGLWPAFWMLPSFDRWPEGIDILAEIDVVEFLGHNPHELHTTVHSNQTGKITANSSTHHSEADLTKDFHTYAVEWDAEHISWFLDGKLLTRKKTPTDLHQPMHMLLNLAVGGRWPGAPDSTTKFPAHFEIDWVRVYRKIPDCQQQKDDAKK